MERRREKYASELVYEDYEDILPHSTVGTLDVRNPELIEITSESSCDVEIIEELSTYPARDDRFLRPRGSYRRPSRASRSSVPGARGRKRGSKKLLNYTSSNRAFTIFNLFEKDAVSVHDLIDYVGTIGASVVSSNKPLQPPQLFAKRRALTSVCNLSQKRKRTTCNEPVEAVVDNYIKTSIQSSQAVFDRLRTHAHKITKGRSAGFTPKNPFLYPWEYDKDRMNGGQWRERRDRFLLLTGATDVENEDQSDSENTPPAIRPGKRKLRATQRNLPGEVDMSKKSAVIEVQPILLGYRWPSEGSQSSASPEKIVFWR
ncbi:hypothetical protein Aperf_G00000061786 [Anoplocephala perfoliata]